MTGDLTAPFIVTYRGTVYPWQCDHMGHMNVMWYVGKFDEASWQLLAMIGLTSSRFRHDGAGMAAVEQRVEYKRELRAGDVVTIRSAVQRVDDKAITVLHELLNDDNHEVAARMIVVGVHIDALARKARPLPADVRARALAIIERATTLSSKAI
jgi:acyl-CoA thioester hydrolase